MTETLAVLSVFQPTDSNTRERVLSGDLICGLFDFSLCHRVDSRRQNFLCLSAALPCKRERNVRIFPKCHELCFALMAERHSFPPAGVTRGTCCRHRQQIVGLVLRCIHQRPTTMLAIARRAGPICVRGSLAAASNQFVLVRSGSFLDLQPQSDAVDLPE
jgi:hypothetical protein